jgi:DNA-binding transcriptional LysR family regulator
MFELGQLRAFVAVATELNFGRAARRLHITQPPLSRQIQALERTLDVTLFVRTTRSVALTPAGHAFLGEARALLRQAEGAVQAARRAAGGAEGTLTVGFIGATCYGFLPRMAARARAELPGLALTLREMESADQFEALALGRIDVGLVRPVAGLERLSSRLVMRERLALAMPADHPLAARRRPDLRQVDGLAFIGYAPEAKHLHDVVAGALAANRVAPRVVQRVTHAQAILALVSAGLGVALVPSEARNACFDNVTFRPVELGEARAELHAAWSGDARNPALPAFRDLLATVSPDAPAD